MLKGKTANAVNTIKINYFILIQNMVCYHGSATDREFGLSTRPDFAWKNVRHDT